MVEFDSQEAQDEMMSLHGIRFLASAEDIVARHGLTTGDTPHLLEQMRVHHPMYLINMTAATQPRYEALFEDRVRTYAALSESERLAQRVEAVGRSFADARTRMLFRSVQDELRQ